MLGNGLMYLIAVLVLVGPRITLLASGAMGAGTLSIETNAPIFKVEQGGSAVKNIIVTGTGVESMQVTDITFGNGREFFRIGDKLPLQATRDPVTGKLTAQVPVIVTLPPELQKDVEYPYTVTATSGQGNVQASSYVLVSVVMPSGSEERSQNSILTVLYIVMAAGGVISILVYKKVAAKRS